jgi:hypothetical protein
LGKSRVVSGKYQSPVDNRRDYTSIIIRKDGQFEAGNLMLDDDVVMDKILSDGSVAVTPAPNHLTKCGHCHYSPHNRIRGKSA